MQWYDVFAHFYDTVLEGLYRDPRTQAVARLRPGLGERVLDLACGTGQNFAPLMERFAGSRLRVVGLDASRGMLAQARRRIQKGGWESVSLVEADVRTLDIGSLARLAGDAELVEGVDYVLCTLGLSVVPDWERVLESAFLMLRHGGQFVIFDTYAERRVMQSWWVEKIARADLSRRSWEVLRELSAEFEMEYLAGSPHVFGGRLFVASGIRGE